MELQIQSNDLFWMEMQQHVSADKQRPYGDDSFTFQQRLSTLSVLKENPSKSAKDSGWKVTFYRDNGQRLARAA